MSVVTQAEFARLHQVSRKTVTTWKKRGYIRFSGTLVDVETSNRLLAGAGRAWPKTVTAADPGCSLGCSSGCGPVTQTDYKPPSEACALSAMCGGSACHLSELLLRHLPMETARSLVAEFLTSARRGAVEMLEEDYDLPPGCASWADHTFFTELSPTEDEWEESAELAAAYIQANGAAPDA